jgi:hypothetical protein
MFEKCLALMVHIRPFYALATEASGMRSKKRDFVNV